MESIGSYRLERLLESSGTVEIYEATDERLGRGLRVKIMAQGATENEKLAFERAVKKEAKSGSVSGSLHELGRTADGRPYAVYGGYPAESPIAGRAEAGETVAHAGKSLVARRRRLWIPIASAFAALIVVAAAITFASKAALTGGKKGPSLAVVPFSAEGIPGGEAYIAPSVSDTIRSGLSRIHGFELAGTGLGTKIAEAKDQRAEARENGVEHLLLGRITRSSGQDLVKAELVRVSDGSVEWSLSQACPVGKPFSVPEKVASGVMEAMKVAWSGNEEKDAFKAAFINPEATALKFQAGNISLQGTVPALSRSADLYRRSLSIEPNQPGVARALRATYNNLSRFDQKNKEAWKGEAQKAQEMIDSLAQREGVDPYWKAMLAFDAAYGKGRYPEAEKALRQALGVVKNDFRATLKLPFAMLNQGRIKESVSVLEAYIKADPFELAMEGVNLSWYTWLAGDYSRGWRAVDKWLAWQPDNLDLLENGAMNLYGLGRYKEAEAYAGKAVEAGYNCEYLVQACRAMAGDKDGPRAAAGKALAAMESEGASIHALVLLKALEQKDEFFAYATKALGGFDDGGCAATLAFSPMFNEWRQDPRFAAIRKANPIKGPDVL